MSIAAKLSQTIRLLPGEVLARRKGGSVIHVMKLTEEGYAPRGGAICGTIARDALNSTIHRAGWYQMKVATRPTCPKCLAMLAERLRDQWREQNPELYKLIAEAVEDEKRSTDD